MMQSHITLLQKQVKLYLWSIFDNLYIFSMVKIMTSNGSMMQGAQLQVGMVLFTFQSEYGHDSDVNEL